MDEQLDVPVLDDPPALGPDNAVLRLRRGAGLGGAGRAAELTLPSNSQDGGSGWVGWDRLAFGPEGQLPGSGRLGRSGGRAATGSGVLARAKTDR